MVLLVDSFREAPDYFWTCLQIFKKHPRLAHGFNATPTGPDPIQVLEFELPRALPRGKLTRIKWDMTSQHTLSWDEPITATLWDTDLKCDVAVSLRPGSCNLYTFPKVVWKTPAAPSKGFLSLVTSAVAANKKKFDVLEGAYLELLKLVFFTIADSHLERDVLKLPDWSGANSGARHDGVQQPGRPRLLHGHLQEVARDDRSAAPARLLRRRERLPRARGELAGGHAGRPDQDGPRAALARADQGGLQLASDGRLLLWPADEPIRWHADRVRRILLHAARGRHVPVARQGQQGARQHRPERARPAMREVGLLTDACGRV
ncbi:hypothetical protein Ctob_000467 [Chrysochromulina tobinii]|uniref:Uncharacterized protein n=1 Tax=Chrysochromulina tobinii TaxID=1460289 RepID=A0A0M0J5G1_9EUKA|nr:hypothetical protein Ctob_000467 [Chrysochromulina tobinii]|eukprot:KOO21552.1 hypothetical protein Ctob_000467 [Chrysochromulina sp. CCMP291]